MDAADTPEDLRVPPGKCLEALRGNRRGQHTNLVNERWRVRFVWQSGDAHEVEIVDYH